MKKCPVRQLALGFSLVALPFLGGCTQQDTGGANPFVTAASAEPVENTQATVAEAVTNATATSEALTNLVAVSNAAAVAQTNATAEAEAAVEVPPPTEQKPPPNLPLSPVLSEAVKLVQSGVSQPVLFQFITNTTGYFSLGADEIVFLNDLGVEGNVITAMMEHDRALRELRANAWLAAQAAASNQVSQELVEAEQPEGDMADAPSYLEPPPMEAEPVYVSTSYFYDTLAPYGTWVYVPGYGRCWRPTVAYSNPGWRPYVDRGRWVYSDCGWYWLSDYTWGATTFHYGRWFNDSRWGWCWWPDTVWAPSWVSWRYTSDYCGWAPLPPNCYYQSGLGLTYSGGSVGVSFGFGLGAVSYAFVPWGSFCSPRPYKYCLPTSSAVHVYNNSKPYNNWEGGGKGKAYNRGMAPERVRELARTEVRTVSVKEEKGEARAERIERDGRTLTVRRPQFTSTSTELAAGSIAPSRANDRQPVADSVQQPVRQAAPNTAARIGDETATRTAVRSAAPATGVTRIESRPQVAQSVRAANRTDDFETEAINRQRTSSPMVAQQPAQPQPPGAFESGNTTTSQPRVIQPNSQPAVRPTPSQRSSIVVIGGNNNRSTGRDYSVWSTPNPARENVSSRNVQPAQPTTVNNPKVANESPVSIPRIQNGNWQNRGNNNSQPAYRANNQPASTPSVGQLTPRPLPAANYNSRPVQSSPAPNYAPRSQPSPQPSAPRVDSRPAPAPSRPSAPAVSPAGQNQGRPSR